MRHARWIACAALMIAACGGSDNTAGDTTAVTDPITTQSAATDPPATEPPPTDPPTTDPPPTDPPPTDPPATEPPPTDPPATDPPPPPLDVVGLVPLPGFHLDFSGNPAASQSLVWSLFSGSGGIIVENVGGVLPPGCHGTSFFDPETFELLQIDGTDAQAYATRGDGGCANMLQELADGVIDGTAVAINTDQLILFDFGAIPAPPFDVSTQVVDPGGGNGVFRSSDPEALLQVNDISTADFIVGADVLLEVAGSDLIVRDAPAPTPGDCTPFFNCLSDRFGIDVLDATGVPGGVMVDGDDSGLFYFPGQVNWEVLVRVLDGCAINDHFWVFAAATTSVEYDLTVTDTLSGESRSYTDPVAFQPVLDTQAFATCP